MSPAVKISAIHQPPLTITANNGSKTYGDTVAFAGTEFTSVGLVGSATGAKVVDFAQFPGGLPGTDTYVKLIDTLVSRLAAALK